MNRAIYIVEVAVPSERSPPSSRDIESLLSEGMARTGVRHLEVYAMSQTSRPKGSSLASLQVPAMGGAAR